MIKLSEINKVYGSKTVVNNINFNIEKGKITSIIGPNGAGKSTLLGMVSRTIERSGGVISINDLDILKWNNNDLAKKVSILKQNDSINARITVKDLVEYGRYPYSKGRLTEEDRVIIDKSIDYMSLADMKDSYITELSGGQKQRAYIASLLAQDTDYILLDEPLNNLDMKYASELLKILRNLVDNLGKTIVIVIHDINFAACYSDNIILLKNGKLAKEGTVKEIMNEQVLEEIYEMPFKIIKVDGKLICSYY